MALPEIPDTVPQLTAPRSPLSAADIQSPYFQLAANMEKAGEVISKDVAVPLAQQAGMKAVSIDDQGNPTVARAPIFGDAALAFKRAVKVSALAQGEGVVKRDDIALRQQFPNDPEGYAKAAEEYRQKKIDQYTDVGGPDLGDAIGKAIDSTTTYTFRSLLSQQQHKIARDFDKSTSGTIDAKTSDLVDLVRTGGAGTDEAKKLAGEIHFLINERSTNPVLGEPKEIADLRAQNLDRQVKAAGAEYRINTILKGPTQFQPVIDTAAAKYGLNPLLLARQLHQESGLNPDVPDSSAGAQGIAQFIPKTAARYGVNVRDPNSSIEGAAHYMGDLTRQFSGNTGLALAGYNWGEGNVAQWLAAGANPAAMPAETRKYVQAITGQPIDAWLGGRRPSATDIQTLGVPAPAQGPVAAALAEANRMRNDPSVDDPTQRELNYGTAIKAIKEFRENNIRLAHADQEQQKQVDNQFEDAIIRDTTSPNPSVTEHDIKTASGVSASSKMRMLSWLKRDEMPEPMARVSQATSTDLFQKITLPEGDPNRISNVQQIRDQYINGNLNRADEEWLEKRFLGSGPNGERVDKVRAEFSHAVSPQIDRSNPLLGKLDESGKMQSYSFERFVDSKIEEYRAGRKNPLDLFDPSKPDYLGKPEVIAPYKVPLTDSINNIRNNLTSNPGTAAAAQRKPNETPAEYLTRVNGAR